jgi:cytochrome d ubiquinol oxidase subunit I
LLKKRDLPFARRSFAIAAIFGLASTLSVILLGDESGYELGDVQKLNSLQLKLNGILNLHLPVLLYLVFQISKKCVQIMQLKFHM